MVENEFYQVLRDSLVVKDFADDYSIAGSFIVGKFAVR